MKWNFEHHYIAVCLCAYQCVVTAVFIDNQPVRLLWGSIEKSFNESFLDKILDKIARILCEQLRNRQLAQHACKKNPIALTYCPGIFLSAVQLYGFNGSFTITNGLISHTNKDLWSKSEKENTKLMWSTPNGKNGKETEKLSVK